MFFSLQAGEPIPYSEFKTRVREGKVQEVTVAEDRIQGKLKAEGAKGQRLRQRSGSTIPSSSRTSSSTA